MKKVCILLSTYNGEAFLDEQINSLLNQSLPEKYALDILVRDDGSSDRTKEILDHYKAKGVLDWYTGENMRPARSFWDLINHAPDSEYYCFCDQDDVWFDNKVKRAIDTLSMSENPDQPLLYCSDVTTTDEHLTPLSDKVSDRSPHTDFANSLIFSLAPGCTMVFNKTARNEFIKYDINKEYVVMHDWLAHKIVAMLGQVVYDPEPSMYYRQHGNNVIGAVGQTNRIRRLVGKAKRVLGSYANTRSDCAKSLMNVYGNQLSEDKKHILNMVANYRKDRSLKKEFIKLKAFETSGGLLYLKALIFINKI